jgi:hypothetical protein
LHLQFCPDHELFGDCIHEVPEVIVQLQQLCRFFQLKAVACQPKKKYIIAEGKAHLCLFINDTSDNCIHCINQPQDSFLLHELQDTYIRQYQDKAGLTANHALLIEHLVKVQDMVSLSHSTEGQLGPGDG